MFKKENRLAPGISFSNSHQHNLPQFVLKEKENGLALNRFGVVVSKRIDKRAVGRNKVKRFFRTALANFNKKMSVGHDILVIAKKEILNKTKEENLLIVEGVLTKAGLFQK